MVAFTTPRQKVEEWKEELEALHANTGAESKAIWRSAPEQKPVNAALRGFAQGNLRREHWTDHVSCPSMQHHHHNTLTKRNGYAVETRRSSLEPIHHQGLIYNPMIFNTTSPGVDGLWLKPANLAQGPMTLEQTSWRSHQLLLSLCLCSPLQAIDSPLTPSCLYFDS